MVSSCVEQGKFEHSFSFSHLCNKIIIGVGCDRDGRALIELMRFIIRICGNSAQHSIPTSVVEKGAKGYDVLKKTIYNKSATNLSLPILLDELCTFTMKFTDTMKCLTLRLMKDGKPFLVSFLSL